MHRWTDHGVMPIDASEIARQAAATARVGRSVRARPWSEIGAGRAILALAALLLLAVGVAFAAASFLRTSSDDACRAVVVRQVDGGVDVVLAGADGSERPLRHVTPGNLGIDPQYQLGLYGLGRAVNQQGWLELWAVGSGDDRAGPARAGLYVLVDLSDPAKAPIILPANGFTSGRWGPAGQYALFCARDGHEAPIEEPQTRTLGTDDRGDRSVMIDLGRVLVLGLDGDANSEVTVPMVQTFGGGPEIVWTADGSGFLAQQGTTWGITPLDGGPFRPGVPKVLSRSMDPSRPDLEDLLDNVVPGRAQPWTQGLIAAAQLAADGEAVWWLLDERVGPGPRALLAKLHVEGPVEGKVTAPEMVELVRRFDLPAAPTGFTPSPDDTLMAVHLEGPLPRFVLVSPEPETATVSEVIDGALAGFVPAAIADALPTP
jgi:hypothetical protein